MSYQIHFQRAIRIKWLKKHIRKSNGMIKEGKQ
jgi:hypothetical protein